MIVSLLIDQAIASYPETMDELNSDGVNISTEAPLLTAPALTASAIDCVLPVPLQYTIATLLILSSLSTRCCVVTTCCSVMLELAYANNNVSTGPSQGTSLIKYLKRIFCAIIYCEFGYM